MSLKEPNIIWITGLSGAGKTTLGEIILKKLKGRKIPTIMLDGDELRKILGVYNFNNLENHKLVKRIDIALAYSRLCKYLSEQGFTIIIATISLYQKVHNWNKLNLKNYYEVYLEVPINELKRRDPKGIYKRYDKGEIKNIAGLDLPIDEPEFPKWHFKFKDKMDFYEVADIILNELYETNI